MTGEIRIQVGSAGNALPGWLNTDINGVADYYLDATRKWPVPEGTVAYVYGDNVIEHLPLQEAGAFLRHALEALAPNGRIRLVTPDVGSAARLYLNGGPDAIALSRRHAENGYEMTYPVDLLRVVFAESEHWRGYCFDEGSLRAELESAGFVNVRRCHVGESDDPVLRDLESRAAAIEDRMQLVLEASAPGPN